MMLVALLASLQAAAPTPVPPANWDQLPALRWKLPPRRGVATSRFVQDEVAAGRCGASQRSGGVALMTVHVAVLASADGRVRAVVPRAVNCPTVEQYTVGLIQRMALDNIDMAGRTTETWYHAAMTYSWSG